MVTLTANTDIKSLESLKPHYRQVIDAICREYRDAITDWCHHSLALEVAAKNTRQSITTVTKVVANFYTGPRNP